MPASKDINIAPLTGVLDTRSTPDLIPREGVRMRQNLQLTAEGKESRAPGWGKLLSKSNYNNSDLHDQLLGIEPVVFDPSACEVSVEGGGGTNYECYEDGNYESSMPTAGTGISGVFVGNGEFAVTYIENFESYDDGAWDEGPSNTEGFGNTFAS